MKNLFITDNFLIPDLRKGVTYIFVALYQKLTVHLYRTTVAHSFRSWLQTYVFHKMCAWRKIYGHRVYLNIKLTKCPPLRITIIWIFPPIIEFDLLPRFIGKLIRIYCRKLLNFRNDKCIKPHRKSIATASNSLRRIDHQKRIFLRHTTTFKILLISQPHAKYSMPHNAHVGLIVPIPRIPLSRSHPTSWARHEAPLRVPSSNARPPNGD